MKSFKELNIKPTKQQFVGDKIKIMKVLNTEIIVRSFKVDKSQYPKAKAEHVMTLQITHQDENKIIFTGSNVLIDQIKQVPEDAFPFKTTIIKNGEHYEFT